MSETNSIDIVVKNNNTIIKDNNSITVIDDNIKNNKDIDKDTIMNDEINNKDNNYVFFNNNELYGNGNVLLSTNQNYTVRRDKAIKYFRLALNIANIFSKDPSTKVGSVFMNPCTYHILSIGYNGMPRGINETDIKKWERPQKYKYVEHAERNGIYNATNSGTSLCNSICVVSMFPCADCARGLIQVGCKMIIAPNITEVFETSPDLGERWRNEWTISMEMLREAKINIMVISNNEINNY